MRAILIALTLLLSACAAPRESLMFLSPYQASGNEPFWHVLITDQTAVIERPDHVPVTRSLHEITNVRSGWELRGTDLKINVTTMRCENDMSGALFTHAVAMELDGMKYKGCGGTELPPDGINMTQWNLTMLGSRALTAEVRPFLAIDGQGKVSGLDGCNRIAGEFAFLPNGTIEHSAQGWISTRMACPQPQMELASEYGKALRASTHWRFEGAHLVLLNPQGVPVLRYQRTY